MSADLLMQQDAQSRQKIVTQIHSNFFVEAGAGSGKTTILVKRMVAMVEQGLDVSKICAITFTKAAAGEFYDRFQKALIRRSVAPTVENFVQEPGELGNPDDVTRKRCLKALNEIDLCFMGTIDAFCNMILSEHPAKAGIPSNAVVLSEEEKAKQYKKAYSDIQNGLYGSELQRLCQRFCGFHDLPEGVFLSAIETLMDTRNCEYVYQRPESTDVDEVLQEEKAWILPVLKTLMARPELQYPKEKKNRSAWELLANKKRLLLSPWAENANQVMKTLKNLCSLRLVKEADLSIFGPAGERMFQDYSGKWFEISEEGLKPVFQKLQDLQYAVTMEFLTAAAVEIAKNLRKEGKLTFFDYLLYLRDTLKADAMADGALIRHIYARHQYFLIDEFQDTNPMQAEVFFYLTAQIPQEDWRKCIPRPGSLFIVGDPKQSIYRFRYADVSAFQNIKSMFTADVGEVVSLTRNFRSTYKMRRWFNNTFRSLLPDDTQQQSKYAPIPLEEEPPADGTFEGVYSYPVFSGKTVAEENKDPARVAKIIQRIVGNPAYMIRRRPEDEPRLVTYADIMLITPKKTRMSGYIKSFTQNEIPFRIEGDVLFSLCPSLVAVSRIFNAVANPNLRQSLIGALTCQRFGFDLNALHRLENTGYDFRLYADHPETEAVSGAMALLKQLVFRSHNLSASALFCVILEELEIFKYVSSKNLEYVYFALELLRSVENAGEISSLPQAAVYLDMLVSDASKVERAISLTKNENRVHIANLHKVKGLEAPIVILADPYGNDPVPTIRVVQKGPKPQCWIFAVKEGYNVVLACNAYPDDKEEEAACLEAEKKRLLYVAATRAQRVLIVADAIDSEGESKGDHPWKYFVDRSEGDFFEDLPVGTPMVRPAKGTADAKELYDEATNLLLSTNSGESSYAIVRPSQTVKLKGKTSSEDNFEDREEADVRTHSVYKNAALVGTLVHSLMEAMVSSRNTASLPALAKEIASEYEAEGDDYVQMLIKVGTTMQNGGFPQLGIAPQDMLKELLEADEVYCEVPFCRKSGRNLSHGIMDVVYRKGEKWFIADYKTNADARGLDEKYEDQLSAYREAFRELTGHDATTMIYHVDV